MKERPIIFSYPMIRAILAGSKTMTRRIVNYSYQRYPSVAKFITTQEFDFHYPGHRGRFCSCPYGSPGDHLWIRETWDHGCIGGAIFKADHSEEELAEAAPGVFKWHPSIHLKRKDARLFLEIISVNVQRLCGITFGDAINEGIETVFDPSEPNVPLYKFYPCKDLRDDTYIKNDPLVSFYSLWCSIKNHETWKSWKENPWVWVIEFKLID